MCRETKAERIGIFRDSDYLPNLCLSFLEGRRGNTPAWGRYGVPTWGIRFIQAFFAQTTSALSLLQFFLLGPTAALRPLLQRMGVANPLGFF